MGNTSLLETASIGDALRSVTALLPAAWSVNQRSEPVPVVRGHRYDAVIELTAPTGDRIAFVVEAKRSGSVPASMLINALRELQRESPLPVLYASDYVGPSLREQLTDQGVSFADSTGWVRIVSQDPLILLTGQGADRSPRARQTTAVTRLNGLAASRTVRALATAVPPSGVRHLAKSASVSPGSVSKLLVTLASEGIVDRDQSGAVIAVRGRALIRRWVRDYSFTKSNPSAAFFIAPRGIERTLARLAGRSGVTLTGSAAARRSLPETVTSVVPLRLLALYAANPAALADDLGLIAADAASGNVAIATPQDDRILNSLDDRDITLAPMPLVLADLLTLPGRSNAEANQLMDALAATDPVWAE